MNSNNMKRKHQANPFCVYKVFPLFDWCKCEFCDFEFRRQRGWCRNWSTSTFYACSDCVSTIDEYTDKIKNADRKRKEQMLSTAPPKQPPMTRLRNV